LESTIALLANLARLFLFGRAGIAGQGPLLTLALGCDTNLDLAITDARGIVRLPLRGRAMHHLAILQIKDRLMPWAFDTMTIERALLQRAAGMAADRARAYLAPDALALFDQLLDPTSSRCLFHRPDFYVIYINLVARAVV